MKTLTFVASLAKFGGIETVFCYEAALLCGKYNINLLSQRKLPENIRQFCDAHSIKYVDVLPKTSWRHPFKKIAYKISKKKFVKKSIKCMESSDIVIDFKNGNSERLIKKVKHLKAEKVLWIHGGMPFVQDYMRHTDFPFFDKIVCLTDAVKEKLCQKYPQMQQRFVRIYNPMDFEKMKKSAEAPLKDVKDERFFTHVSRIDKDKDIKTLIDGYNLYFENSSARLTPPLYIIGDGTERKHMEAYAQTKSAAKQIRFLGMRANPFPYMKKAAAVILSSPAEGLACVLLEALCVTKGVVVSSDCPEGPKEILADGKFGKLFQTGNAGALADVLQKIDEGKITHDMFTKGLEKHLDKFRMETIQKQLIDLFEDHINE